ncbi:HEPN domain-containing protein [Pseudomonas sp. 5P_3.1_Bac2]|uniref:ApeA N-terminal domain 1-containing protein n=1 Tax=Pseudomonas sp. 5P_3.1_Bac2 TaxID=2971617 RepID=UPI0021CAC4D6|nr:HEPN domain-containing protein [Pseudomonas sp. 5P_3.1_Bac2]MCU1719407.1 hypothetical protein [Pseudomonas sp. 5P_3.1_Bac2]
MYVPEPIIRKGFFWKAGCEDHKASGILTIKNGGTCELEIIGSLDEDQYKFLEGNLETNFTICGNIDTDDYATLYNCHYKKNNMSFNSGITSSIIKPQRVILGVAFDDLNPTPKYKKIRFEFTNTESWVDISGFKRTHTQNQNNFLIEYNLPEKIQAELTNIGAFNIGFTNRPIILKTEINSRQITYFEIEPTHPIDMENAVRLIRKIQDFLTFAIQKTVTIKNIKATLITGLEAEETEYPFPVSWYYESPPSVAETAETKKEHVLFTTSEVLKTLEAKINKFLELYETSTPSFWLYISTLNGTHRYMESTFLSLSQASESYQRNISKTKNINFRNRIEALTTPFTHLFKFDLGDFLDTTTNTRNYLTHYNEKIKAKSAYGFELYLLNKRLKDFITLNILKDIGFTQDEIALISKKANLLIDNF